MAKRKKKLKGGGGGGGGGMDEISGQYKGEVGKMV